MTRPVYPMTRTEHPTQVLPLPPLSSLPQTTLAFLNAKLTADEDLHHLAPVLASELRTECEGLDRSLSDLSHHFNQLLADYSLHSSQIGSNFEAIRCKLSDLRASTVSPAATSSDGGSGRLLGEELPALAKEVARVEAVRTYAGCVIRILNSFNNKRPRFAP